VLAVLLEFVTFVRELFPGINPYTAANCIAAIKQHGEGLQAEQLFSSQPPAEPSDLVQGDLVGPLTFTRVTADGTVRQARCAGMLLSNSCDVVNDPHAIFAAALPAEAFDRAPRLSSIRTNTVFNLLYLPEVPRLGGQVVDMSLVQTVSREHLRAGLTGGSITRYVGLSQLGYYLFLSKLTVHLLRPETEEIQRET
jgi:hypothetical protein